MPRNILILSAEASCEICNGTGLRPRGAIQIFCYCVKSEGVAPGAALGEARKPYETPSVESSEDVPPETSE